MSDSKNKNLIIMNWNGVLIESFPLCLEFAKVQCPAITAQEYMEMFDDNFYQSAEKREDFRFELDQDGKDFKYNYFLPAKFKLPAYPGMKEVVDRLSKLGNLAINTSTSDISNTTAWLEKEGMDKYFVSLEGAKEVKSKAQKIVNMIKGQEVESKNVLYITDKIGDAKEALSVDVPVILVTWGFQPKDHLLQVEDEVPAIVDTPRQLLSEVEKRFA